MLQAQKVKISSSFSQVMAFISIQNEHHFLKYLYGKVEGTI
jgi:hypothetical protein